MLTRILIVLLSVTVLLGCGDRALVENVSAKQSVTILVTLQKHGISASRTAREGGRDVRYDIQVDANSYEKSLAILHEYHLPADTDASISELTTQKGFVPNSPEMMAFRMDHALALEAERLMRTLPKVVDVKVLIRSSLTNGSWTSVDASQEPRASVVVRISQDDSADAEALIDEIRTIVARTVPGLKKENVEVVSSILSLTGGGAIFSGSGGELHQVHGLNFHVPNAERSRAYQSLFVLVLSSFIVGALLVFAAVMWIQWRERQRFSRLRRNTTLFTREALPDRDEDYLLPPQNG